MKNSNYNLNIRIIEGNTIVQGYGGDRRGLEQGVLSKEPGGERGEKGAGGGGEAEWSAGRRRQGFGQWGTGMKGRRRSQQ